MCRICDELTVNVNEAGIEGRENESMKLKEQHTLHLDEAKEMQDSLKIETEGATANPKLGVSFNNVPSAGPANHEAVVWACILQT
jgi:hypothetical protein